MLLLARRLTQKSSASGKHYALDQRGIVPLPVWQLSIGRDSLVHFYTHPWQLVGLWVRGSERKEAPAHIRLNAPMPSCLNAPDASLVRRYRR